MEEVYQSRFMRILFEAKTGILHEIWSSETVMMNDEDFKAEIAEQIKASKDKKPTSVFVNGISMLFPISLELQQWMNTEVFPTFLKLGLRKIAFLSSADLVTEISIEQTMDESTGASFESGFFNDRDMAKDWLMLDNSPQNPT